MADERIDIEVTDKVSPQPAKKLRDIASAALQADSAVDRLKASLMTVDATAVDRLASASAKLTNAQAREVSATARLESARARVGATNARVAVTEQRLATETARTEAATARANAALSASVAAAARAESASLRLAAAKDREASAQARAAQAAGAAGRAYGVAGQSAGALRAQTQNLVFQVQDVIVGLQAGQAPLTVLLQQGTQIAGAFGPGAGVTGILQGLVRAVGTMVAPFLPVIAVLGVAAAGFGILTNEINKTTDVGVTMGDVIKASVQLAAEAIYSFFKPAIDFLAPYFKKAYDLVIDATKFVVNGVVGYWVGTFNAIKVVWDNFPAIMRDVFALGINAMLDIVQSGMTGIITAFSGSINNITGLFVGGYNAIVGVWGLLPDAFYNLGVNAMNGLIGVVEAGIKGIINAVDALLTFIGSAAELVGADNPFANLLDAENIVDLSAYRGTLRDTGAGIAETISGGFRDAFATDYAAGLVNALDLSGYRQEVTGAASDAAAGIASAYQDAFSTDYAGSAFSAIRERAISIARDRIAAEAEADKGTAAGNASLSRKMELLKEINKPLDEYRTDVAALSELLAEGAISAGQFNQALASLSLVKSLRDVDTSLVGTPFADAAALDEVRIAEQERLNIVQMALEARILTEQDAAERIVAINRQTAADIQEIEAARNSMILTGASNTFASLAEAARGFAGEQSGIYKALFITSKAFAIADSIMKIQQGIANALALPFPANIGAAATVAAEAANIVSAIQAVQFADGGRVVGPGGPRDDKILAKLSNGEFVMNAAATRRNLPMLEAMNNGGSPRVPQYADGGQVQQAYRAPTVTPVRDTVGSNQPGGIVVNVNTRDPGTTVSVTRSQQAAQYARAAAYGQRNL